MEYVFLARPRRFGKSLFLSSLRYFFEGRRELFKGLYIDSTDWDWAEYPVLRLDLNTDCYAEQGKLEGVLDYLFRRWEEKYDVKEIEGNHSQRFKAIIEGWAIKKQESRRRQGYDATPSIIHETQLSQEKYTLYQKSFL